MLCSRIPHSLLGRARTEILGFAEPIFYFGSLKLNMVHIVGILPPSIKAMKEPAYLSWESVCLYTMQVEERPNTLMSPG